MSNKYICSSCKSHFYADIEIDDFEIKGKYFCSYCYPKTKLCLICGEIKVFKRKITSDTGICEECKEKTRHFNNIYLTLRFRVFTRDNFTCRYCGRSPLQHENIILHCDHIIPQSKEGQDVFDNLITSCQECNMGKMDIVLEEYQINLIKGRKFFGIE